MKAAFVIDASATLAWVFAEPGATWSIPADASDATMAVPPLWRLEVVNAVLVKERQRRLTQAQSTRAL